MVHGLLFRWEDSHALKHHCGICERPLSHPGARASCFGTHAEPCHRFHQGMFMRLRAHTCTYCLSIDEAHYKRHKDIAEQLSSVYESCDEVDWTIVPSESEERGRLKELDSGPGNSGETDRSFTPENTTSSKRERKDAKRLARAASRSRVITQDEIRYVDSVLHSADCVSSSDSDGPRNPEEIEEIERHLRYNAHVYNTQENRRGLKKFAQLSDADVDFDAEMERILETFRISELIKRNTRNRGLQGKELKTFLTLVDDFKKAVVEDLVLVKKDVLEVRMRRAGYLRYTNKTAYGIVEDRYTDKDWKTGEKFTSSSSGSSSVMSPLEEISPLESKQQENSTPRPPPSLHRPDRRHLESIHKRVNGEDGLFDTVIEPYRAPLLPLPPDPTPRKQLISLRVVADKASETGSGAMNAWGKKTAQPQQLNAWQTVYHNKKPTAMVVKPSWGDGLVARSSGTHRSSSDSKVDPDISSLPSSIQTKGDHPKDGALAVQPPAAAAVTGSDEPERFLTEIGKPLDDPADGHPVVSQKRQAKKVREARRKAKKAAPQEDIASTPMARDDIPDGDIEDVNTSSTSAPMLPVAEIEDTGNAQEHDPPDILAPPSKGVALELHIPEVIYQEELSLQSFNELSPPSPPHLPVTKHGKHMHWIKFTRNFAVDQLTNPFLEPWTGCSHSTACMFEGNSVPDCPFHEPHCPCVDPLQDMCCLVYPCDDLCTAGPYNRLHGEKLLEMYENHSKTKGRVMLVDDDLIYYFMLDPSSRARNSDSDIVPKRLASEYANFADGHNPGPLMEQERQFERLWHKNGVIKQQISAKILQDIQRQHFDPVGVERMCYCQDTLPDKGVVPIPKDVVMCSHRDCKFVYFHKSCVKKLGVEKVSRWFCTSCEEKMKELARQTLRDLGYTDVQDEGDADEDADEGFDTKKLKKLLNMPVTNELTVRIRGVGSKVKGVSVMPFGVDEGGKMRVKVSRGS